MERILVLIVVLVTVEGFKHQHHPKFPKPEEDRIRKVACDRTHDRLRDELIEKSQCGEPREVFVELPVSGSYLQASPSSVWVKRCVGLCDFEAPGSKCVPTKTRFEEVPVRIYNAKTKKETCSTFSVEVHEACGCCASTASSCGAPRVFNPRKCSCQCPDLEERRRCLRKRNQNMRWNRYKCACEAKRRIMR